MGGFLFLLALFLKPRLIGKALINKPLKVG
jgi:hypothetical protein